MSKRSKVLVIEAHSDDSAISASGLLMKLSENHEIHFLLISVSDISMHHCGLVTRDQRMEEYNNYVSKFDGHWFQTDMLPLDADSQLDMVSKSELVSHIENAIDHISPSILIVQGPSFHHDHTIVYEASIAATRPTARHCPAEIYVMENPTYVHSLGPSTDFYPDFYIGMNKEELEAKIRIFMSCFPTQVRNGPNYLSPDGIRAWSRYRGIEARREFAEAFKTYKRVI